MALQEAKVTKVSEDSLVPKGSKAILDLMVAVVTPVLLVHKVTLVVLVQRLAHKAPEDLLAHRDSKA